MIHTTKNNPVVGIYKITSPSGKIYIGQAINIIERFESYRKIQNCKGQKKLYNSLIFYGSLNHIFDKIEECLESQLNIRERYWQDYYDVLGPNGLNLILTKTNSKSGKLSEEVCLKKSNSMKGKYIRKGCVLSDETKKLMSSVALGKAKPWLKGRKERSEKISKSNMKIVIQYDLNENFIKEWVSIKEAEICLKISNISACCRGKQNTSGGFVWKYKE